MGSDADARDAVPGGAVVGREASPEEAARPVGDLSPGGEAAAGRRLVFVGGAPRTGTTLVQNMLDSHPEVLGGPEFHHLPDIVDLRRRLHESLDREWIDEFCTRERADELLRKLIEAFLLPLADRHERPILSEKTPSNVKVFGALLELFPAARCVHVVRDPRAVVASMLKVGRRAREQGWDSPRFTKSTLEAIGEIRRSYGAGLAAEAEHAGRVLHVRYEDVVTDPAGESRRMCEFLGLDWSDRMVHPGRFEHVGASPIVNEVWYREEEYQRDPDPAELGKWRGRLSGWQEAAVTAAFRNDDTLARLGYALEDGTRSARLLGGLLTGLARAVPLAVPKGLAKVGGAARSGAAAWLDLARCFRGVS